MTSTIMVMSCCLVAFSLFACSDDDIVGDPAKDWGSNSTERYIPVDEKGFSTFYCNSFGTVGDPMPFFDPKAGNFKILYLQEYYKQNDQYCFHPIWAVQTSDGCNYGGMGVMLPAGSNRNQPWERAVVITTKPTASITSTILARALSPTTARR